MNYLKIDQLVDGKYYEGEPDEAGGLFLPNVAKWCASENLFSANLYTWQYKDTVTLSHPDKLNEYFGVFYPKAETEPKDFEVVK